VRAGVQHSNLRQIAEAEAARRGIAVQDIRAREAGRLDTAPRDGVSAATDEPGDLELRRESYAAAGGDEVFLGLEQGERLVGFLRLRRVASPHRPELQAAGPVAIVRELKVYGVAQPLGAHSDEVGAFQHHGHGARLLAAAEGIAFGEWQAVRLLVIAGTGVKPYYRKHGYADLGPYVRKDRAAWNGTP
jgi:elongator complex protein 3